jgi:hypothetical protein
MTGNLGSLPMPRIDHVMVLVDEDTYLQASASAFLSGHFARLKEKRAESSVAGQYSTLGIAGGSTLIELFGAGLPGPAPLTGGLVFSFEEPGSAAAARAVLDASSEVKYHHDLVTRTVDGSPVPWYHLISVDLGEASPLLLFLNEVTAEYFAAAGARPAPDGAFRRSDYLDAALGARTGTGRLMRDIVGVTLLVRPERARRISAALGAFGYAAVTHALGQELRGPGLTVRLHVDDDESALERITEIEVELADGTPETAVHQFGRSARLEITVGGISKWIFA